MNTANRWLDWTSSQPQVIETSLKTEPAKPSKLSFAGFDSSVSRVKRIIQGAEPGPTCPSEGCPYTLPEGVKLVRFEQKTHDVVLAVYSVVKDPDKFIRHALLELDARLRNPVQIKAGDSVFELLSKLADCGLELRLQWPPEEGAAKGE